MRILSKCKTWVMLGALALAVSASNITAEAKIVTKKMDEKKEVVSVGYEVDINDASGIKVNKKSLAKSKKKVKSVQTATNPESTFYHTKAYFANSAAYGEGSAATAAYNNNYTNAIKYIATGDYELRFLKTGTYKITYNTYEQENIGRIGERIYDPEDKEYYNTSSVYDPATGKYYYRFYSYDRELVLNNGELFERKQLEWTETDEDGIPETVYGDTYFEGVTTHAIYAYSSSEDTYVTAVIATGGDGKPHVKYNPANEIKYVHTTSYKVLKTTNPVASIKLGKTNMYVNKSANKAYGSKASVVYRKFLKGNSGKLTVKMSNKNYKLTGILVVTYDAEGNPLYQKVGNKKTIAYGSQYLKRTRSGKDYYTGVETYSEVDTSMYKPTTIYIAYQNKHTGAFSKFDLVPIPNDPEGRVHIQTTYRYAGDTEDRVATSDGGPYATGSWESFEFSKK